VQDVYQDRELTIDGLRLHYTEWGDPDAETLLCVGGIMQEAHVWDLFAETMSKRYRVLCLDLRGQGDSDWTREGYTLDAYIRDIHGFIRRTNALGCHFIGHSLGARIALAYCGLYHGEFASIVLSDFGPGIEREAALAIRAGLEKYWKVNGWRNRDEALAYWRERYPRLLPVFHQKYVDHNLRLNWAKRLVPKADPDLFFLTTSATAADLDRLWMLAAKVECPVYLARAVNKQIPGHVSDKIVDRMKREMRNLSVGEFDTTHSIFQEAPEEFATKVQKFLDSVPSRQLERSA
jgi:pimeloyl-ACP methyl ester carboxylesterase